MNEARVRTKRTLVTVSKSIPSLVDLYELAKPVWYLCHLRAV